MEEKISASGYLSLSNIGEFPRRNRRRRLFLAMRRPPLPRLFIIRRVFHADKVVTAIGCQQLIHQLAITSSVLSVQIATLAPNVTSVSCVNLLIF